MADKKMDDLAVELQLKAEAQDFMGAMQIIKDNKDVLTTNIQAHGVREILKKATKDRLLLSFVDAVGFGVRPLAESLGRLERLMGFTPGSRGVWARSSGWTTSTAASRSISSCAWAIS